MTDSERGWIDGPRERERVRTPEGRLEAEFFYRAVVAAMGEGIVVQDADGAILACNDSALSILGVTEDEIMGRTSFDPRWRAVREDGTDFPGDEHPAMVTLRTGQPQNGVVMGVHKPDGELRWITINTRALGRGLGVLPKQVVATFVDVTDRRRQDEALLALARSDALTGLANRAHFLDELNRAVARAERHGRTVALLYLDLDGFKGINDTYGHDAGDEVLRAVSARLRASLRRSDFLARLGGDEFTVLLEEIGSEQAAIVAEKIIARVGAPLGVDGTSRIGVSIGIAVHPICGGSPETLLKSADAAMYAAKRDGRGRYCLATSGA